MAAGILSVGAKLNGLLPLSDALLVLACIALALTLAVNLARGGFELRRFVLVALTWVAACGVISDRLRGVSPAASDALMVLALAGFGVAVVAVLRHAMSGPGPVHRWPVRGSWLLAAVALQSVAILLAAWSTRAAAGVWVAGLAVYLVVAVLIVRRILMRAVRIEELTPDYWITMGALAISTVALFAIEPPHQMVPVEVATWAAAAAWVPFLCIAEAVRARRSGLSLRHDAERWSTVFPLGMLGVASHYVAAATGAGFIEIVAIAMFWAGIAVAAVNAGSAARRF